jgi:Mg2+/citrate symporter
MQCLHLLIDNRTTDPVQLRVLTDAELHRVSHVYSFMIVCMIAGLVSLVFLCFFIGWDRATRPEVVVQADQTSWAWRFSGENFDDACSEQYYRQRGRHLLTSDNSV